MTELIYRTGHLTLLPPQNGQSRVLGSVGVISEQIRPIPLIPVSTGASSGLFEFNADNEVAAEEVRKQAEDILNNDAHLKHATFVIDVCRASPDFVTDRESLLARNRWRQMQQPTVAIPEWNARENVRDACEEDLVRPATSSRKSAEKTRVSASVKARWEFGREQKQDFYREHTGMTMSEGFAHDLDELTNDRSQGNLHHKMALIYIDGNGFGKLQNNLCKDTNTQKEFDGIIKGYRRDFLTELLQSMRRQKESWLSLFGRYRLETLLWGGDEIIWVVPAWQGWRTLALFYQQSKNWEFAGRKLTHAAGIVFCHYNAPIHRIRTLAESLAELAKEEKKGRAANQYSFLALESFDHVGRDLRTFLKERSEVPDEPVLSGCKDRMIRVENDFSKLKRDESFPRSKLHQIVQQLRKNQTRAAQIIKDVTKNPNAELEAVRSYFGTSNVGWLHIAELWDYIGT